MQDADVGNIGHPELVYRAYAQALREVWIDREAMVTVRGGDPSLLSRPTRPVSFPHDPGYLLVVDGPSLTLELFGNPSVPIPWEL